MRRAAVDVTTPFGDQVEEIPLSSAPLIAVVSQIRFPPIASITHEEFIGSFQEQIRRDFPVLRKEREVSVVLSPDGVGPAGEPTTVWRFSDRPHEPEWTVSLAPSFIALDTSKYESRANFLKRLRSLLVALGNTIAPSTCDRIGVRYVDRVLLDESNNNLADLVRPEVLGVTTVDPGGEANLSYSVSDTEFRVGEATLHGRWGMVPPGVQMDPLHGMATDSPSWILDLDMYSSDYMEFDVDLLISASEHFAECIYRFFRWATRPDLLHRYGGII